MQKWHHAERFARVCANTHLGNDRQERRDPGLQLFGYPQAMQYTAIRLQFLITIRNPILLALK